MTRASLTPLERSIFETANELWTQRTVANRIRKLGEEFGELGEALIEYAAAANAPGNPRLLEHRQKLREESADVGIVLSDLCAMLGFSLYYAMREKNAANLAKGRDLLRMLPIRKPAPPRKARKGRA